MKNRNTDNEIISTSVKLTFLSMSVNVNVNVLNSNQKYCQASCDGNVSSRTVICHMSFIRMKNLSPDIDFIKNNAS